MTAKEKVLKVHPSAYASRPMEDDPYWRIYPDLDLTSYVELGSGFSEEAAWKNAAESLPAQPVCKNCHKFKAMHESWMWCVGGEPEKKKQFFQPIEPVESLPVEAKEKPIQQPIPCPTCKAPVFVRENGNVVAHYNWEGDRCAANETKMPCDCWKREMQVCDVCQGVAEPKPTPSTPSEREQDEKDLVISRLTKALREALTEIADGAAAPELIEHGIQLTISGHYEKKEQPR